MVRLMRWRRSSLRSKRDLPKGQVQTISTDGTDEDDLNGIASATVAGNTHVRHHVDCCSSPAENESFESENVSLPQTNQNIEESPQVVTFSDLTSGAICCSQGAVLNDVRDEISVREQSTTHRRKENMKHVESFECIYQDPAEDMDLSRAVPTEYLRRQLPSPSHDSSCACRCRKINGQILPATPAQWPQAPLMFRPKPNSTTKVTGIRKDGTNEYVWKPGQTESWWQKLRREWGHGESENHPKVELPCEHCLMLPINNGNEAENEALVVDFESPFFEGSILLKLRGTDGTTPEPSDDSKGFFADNNLRYQVLIRGRFRKEIAFYKLLTGTRLDRPCGKLPPKWVLWTAMKIIHFFAPQLQTKLEKVIQPHVLSPLGSAPRSIHVDNLTSEEGRLTPLDTSFEEPTEAEHSLMGRNNRIKSPLDRSRARKRQLDQWYMARKDTPLTDLDKTYTFEFLQHLFDYQHFTIELGNSMHWKVKDILNGQPLQMMAEVQEGESAVEFSEGENTLWAFEIWNECLWEDAKAHCSM